VFEAPIFHDNRHMKVLKYLVLRTGPLYPQEVFLVLISGGRNDFRAIVQQEGLCQMSMKNFNDTIRNRTRDIVTCSLVSQLTAPMRAPIN
jgi:hypothetical protein